MPTAQSTYARNAPFPVEWQPQNRDTGAAYTDTAGEVKVSVFTGNPKTSVYGPTTVPWNAGRNAYRVMIPASVAISGQILRVEITCYDPADHVTKLDFSNYDLFDGG